jgi:cytochrome P450
MELFSEEMRRDPFPLYARLRSASPVFHAAQFGLWMILDYEGVKDAINDLDTFSSAASRVGGKPFDWLIFSDPPRHTRLRTIVMRAFTPRVIASLEPRIQQLSRELLDRAISVGAASRAAPAQAELIEREVRLGSPDLLQVCTMDLALDYAVPLPIMVIAEMLGIPIADRAMFKRWSDAILGLANTLTGGEEAVRAASNYGAATVEMDAYLIRQLEDRCAAPRDALLNRVLEAEVDGERLTHREILGFFQLLLLAGSETTTNLINNAILSLIEFPRQLERLRGAPELIPTAIEEVLRYRSPLQAVFRQTTRDVTLAGQTIPRGQLVLLVLGSANRDPRQFPDADRFDIHRDPNPHIAFGHGPHFCLGAPLARLEARIALTDLLNRLSNIGVTGDAPWPPRQALHVLGPSSLPIRFECAMSSAGE